jgi:hypothetical protein
MMPRIRRYLAAVVCLAALAAARPCRADSDKADALAREAVEQFTKAVKAEDVDAVMKLVDVPFFFDGKRVIKDRDELRKEFTDAFDEKDLTQISVEIKEIHAFEAIEEKLKENDREMLKEVLAKGDRVVVLEVDSKEKVGLAVRIRDGQAKIVGLRD